MEKTRKGWYWSGETNFFDRIFYWDDDLSDPDPLELDLDYGCYGPFKSFSEAKKAAVQFYRTDIAYAQEAIGEIKAFRKK